MEIKGAGSEFCTKLKTCSGLKEKKKLHDDLHVFGVKLHDLVDQRHLLGDVVVVEEVRPAVALLKIPNLG